jgi:hypothetical protein
MEQNEPLNRSSALPPLRIHHFLTWMLVIAAFVTVEKGLLEFTGILVESALAIHSVIGISALTALIFVLYWHRTGHAFLTEPGHGLLIIESFDLIWGGICLWALHAYDPFQNTLISSRIAGFFIGWAGVISLSMQSCLGVLLCCYRRWPARWRRFYLFYAVVFGLSAFVRLGWYVNMLQITTASEWIIWIDRVISTLPLLCTSIGLVFVCVCDQRDKIAHHWSHWCGVICLLSVAIISVSGIVWNALFPREWTSYPPVSTP